MPKRLPDDQRAAILADVKADVKSAGQIARDHGVSITSVRNIAAEAGIGNAFARENTKRATAAKQVDLAARRVELKALLLEDAFWLRERARGKATVNAMDPKSGKIIVREIPAQSGDVRNYYAALGISVDKFRNLDALDVENGTAHAQSMLGKLAEGLSAAAQAMADAPDQDESRDVPGDDA